MKWFKESLLPEVAFPFLAKAFSFTFPGASPVGLGIGLRVVDAFIVKYNAEEGLFNFSPPPHPSFPRINYISPRTHTL